MSAMLSAPALPPAADFTDAKVDGMVEKAKAATGLLKALAHESRLLILCYLASGEKSVTDLENLLSMRQPAVSQQLMRLRLEGLVETRREGKTIYYRINDPRAAQIIATVYDIFCRDAAEACPPPSDS